MPEIVGLRNAAPSLGAIRDEGYAHRHECAVNDFSAPLNRAHLCFEKRQAQLLGSLNKRSFVDRVSNPSSGETGRVSGRDRLALLNWALNSMGLERSQMQKGFHLDMVGACARLIFKQDLEANLDDLLVELGITELRSEFMAITPRRTGKTYSVAMFVVAYLFAVENSTQSIFSTGRRASQKLIELIYKLLCKIPGMKSSIIKHTVETIWIKGPYDGDIRKVSSYPSNPKISNTCLLFFFWFLFSLSPSPGPKRTAEEQAVS